MVVKSDLHLVSTYLPPSATSHALKSNLGGNVLVVTRINRLDVLELLPTTANFISSSEFILPAPENIA